MGQRKRKKGQDDPGSKKFFDIASFIAFLVCFFSGII